MFKRASLCAIAVLIANTICAQDPDSTVTMTPGWQLRFLGFDKPEATMPASAQPKLVDPLFKPYNPFGLGMDAQALPYESATHRQWAEFFWSDFYETSPGSGRYYQYAPGAGGLDRAGTWQQRVMTVHEMGPNGVPVSASFTDWQPMWASAAERRGLPGSVPVSPWGRSASFLGALGRLALKAAFKAAAPVGAVFDLMTIAEAAALIAAMEAEGSLTPTIDDVLDAVDPCNTEINKPPSCPNTSPAPDVPECPAGERWDPSQQKCMNPIVLIDPSTGLPAGVDFDSCTFLGDLPDDGHEGPVWLCGGQILWEQRT